MAKQNQPTFALLKHKYPDPVAETVRKEGIAFPPRFGDFAGGTEQPPG
jgi:hypothetical protein